MDCRSPSVLLMLINSAAESPKIVHSASCSNLVILVLIRRSTTSQEPKGRSVCGADSEISKLLRKVRVSFKSVKQQARFRVV